MKIIIESIPHSDQKYNTAGDYWREPDGSLHIVVSDTGNEIYNSLIGLHEWVEVMLMEQHGLPLIVSTEFDIPYEKDRERGKHGPDDEPGDDPACPYHKEHRVASIVEMIAAHELDVDWNEYGNAVAKL